MTTGHRLSTAGLGWLAPAMLLAMGLCVLPLLLMLTTSLSGSTPWQHHLELFQSWSFGATLLRTLRISMMVTAVCVLLGYPVAYLLAFSPPRLRRIYTLLVLMCFCSSILVRNFAWLHLLRQDGALNVLAQRFLSAPVQLLYNETGVVIAMAGTLLPLMIFPIRLALQSQSPALLQAAASLGAPPSRSFFSVTLPLSIRGVLTGSVLVYATALGFFITPALLGGGRVLTAATFITQQIEDFVNWPLAAAAATLLLLLICLLTVAYVALRRHWPDARQHA